LQHTLQTVIAMRLSHRRKAATDVMAIGACLQIEAIRAADKPNKKRKKAEKMPEGERKTRYGQGFEVSEHRNKICMIIHLHVIDAGMSRVFFGTS
jgi:ribosomal protein L13E